jgi:hypothetical protein
LKTFTKLELIEALKKIREMGWVPNARPGNSGGVGNTLEDLLGIVENNLPIPNASEWELKAQRLGTSSLTTLFHMEPSPRAIKFVPSLFLPKYGWRHKTIGDEKSFRQTINAVSRTDRGFWIRVDRGDRKVVVSFDCKSVGEKHKEWLAEVESKAGLGEISPAPYWGFDDLFHKAATKLLNCFYIQAEVKKEAGLEYFHYTRISTLEGADFDKFLIGLERGYVFVDFDARSGHNHGTKFRMTQDKFAFFYKNVTHY